MPEDSAQGLPGHNKTAYSARLEAGLKEIDRERENAERDQDSVRLFAKVVFPLVSFLAPPVFVFLALFAVFLLNKSTAAAFNYAVILLTVAITVIFGVLAYFSRRAVTNAQFTFVRVFSSHVIDEENSEFKDKPGVQEKLKEKPEVVLEQPKTVADWIEEGLKGHYVNYAKKLQQPGKGDDVVLPVYELVHKYLLSRVHALVAKRFFFPAYALVTLAVTVSGLAYFVTQESSLLANNLTNQISIAGVLLFVLSFVGILSLWRRSLTGLHEPRIWGSKAFLTDVDYIHGTFPIRIRTGDSRQVMLHFLRDEYECELPTTQYLEAEIQAAGVDISSEKKLRLPDCFQTQKILWSCRFPNTGKHTVTLSLNKADVTKNTKDIIYATDFTTEVVSPFRTSLQAAMTVAIPIISALAALLVAILKYSR